jgi:outer membrane protein W
MSTTQNKPHLAAAALAVVLVLLFPASARADDEWIFRIDLVGLAGTDNTGGAYLAPSGAALKSNAGRGLSLALEYRFRPRLGVEVGATFASFGSGIAVSAWPAGVNVSVRGFVPLSAALNVHLLPENAVDLYVGPMMTYSVFSETELSSVAWPRSSCATWADGLCSASFASEAYTEAHNDLGFGLQAGIDIPFGDRNWGFHANVKYLDVTQRVTYAGSGQVSEVDLNPFVIGFGLSFKF